MDVGVELAPLNSSKDTKDYEDRYELAGSNTDVLRANQILRRRARKVRLVV
jgi:hypothetical protein